MDAKAKPASNPPPHRPPNPHRLPTNHRTLPDPSLNQPSNLPSRPGPSGEDTSARLDWYCIIDMLNVPESEKGQIKKWIRESEARKLEILITGRTGAGKSTLVNGLVGEDVAEEGHNLCATTKNVTGYKLTTKEGFEIVVWDSPGLQDGSGNEEEYLAEMKERCSNVDIVIYCIKLDTRDQLRDTQNDFSAIMKLTNIFGPQWWEHSIFVMTFANQLESRLKAKLSQIFVVEKFKYKIKSWKNKIHEALSSAGVPQEIVSRIPVEAAGCVEKPHLPGQEYWFSILWFMIAHRTKRQTQPVLVKLNASRFKTTAAATATDFTQPYYKQPIFVNAGIGMVTIASGMAVGAGIGTGIGFSVGATVGLGIGAPVGGAIGGIAGVVVSALVYLWKQHKAEEGKQQSK